MLYPTINDLTKGKFNRYELSLATAKCARIVTDEYTRQREEAEKAQTGNKETDKPINTLINKELRDEKAVKTAIKRLHEGEYEIVRRAEDYVPAVAVVEAKEVEIDEEPIDFNAPDEEDEELDLEESEEI